MIDIRYRRWIKGANKWKARQVSQIRGASRILYCDRNLSALCFFIKIVPYNPYQFYANEKSRYDLDFAEARATMEVFFFSFILGKKVCQFMHCIM